MSLGDLTMKIKHLSAIFVCFLLLISCGNNASGDEEVTLKKVEVYENPTLTRYYVGDYFDPAGLKIRTTNSKEETEVVDYSSHESDFTFNPGLGTPLKLSDEKVVLTYQSLTTDISINVREEVIPTEVNFSVSEITKKNSHTELQENYAKTSDPDNFFKDNYSKDNLFGRKNLSTPEGIEIKYTITDNGDARGKYEVVTSELEDFSNSYTHEGRETSTRLYNLKNNTTYFYKVKVTFGTSSFYSDVNSFKTENTTIRNIYVDGVENVRDLGGYVTESGKTFKQGLIYRTAQFNYDHSNKQAIKSEPTEAGKMVLLRQLGIKTEIDVREKATSSGKDETAGITSSPLGESVNYVNLPMKFGGTNVIANANNKDSFKSFLEYCSNENNYPIAFHCVRGTDRTGAMAYAIGALCGVSELDLMKDYLFSNFSNIDSLYLTTEEINGEGFYVQGIHNEVGESLSEKAANYLINNVGVDSAVLDSIKNILLEG